LAKFDYVICDEVHHYAAPTNFRFLIEGTFGFVLGLTATLKRSDSKEIMLINEIGPVIYRLGNQEAIKSGYIADYSVNLISCKMTELERNKYNAIQNEFRQLMLLFNYNFDTVKSTIRAGYRHINFKHAVQCMRIIQERKAFLAMVESKQIEALKLIADQPNKKWIVFDELMESANKFHQTLLDLGFKSAIYHSKIKSKDRKKAVEDYKNDKINILVSVKALDEGLDVRGAEAALVINGNSQERQIKQRLGRILRRSGDKVGQLFMLFIPGTKDEAYVKKRVRALNEGDDEDEF
jgi:superfamily II DNA or RNA helicase